MKKRMKNLIIANTLVALCVIAFIVLSYVLTKHEISSCMFLQTVHLYCPGCGGTRALLSLLKLDFIDSLLYNPTVLSGITAYIYYNIRAFVEIKRNNESYFEKEKYYLIIVVVVIMVINFIVKNILLFNGIDIIGDVFGKGII